MSEGMGSYKQVRGYVLSLSVGATLNTFTLTEKFGLHKSTSRQYIRRLKIERILRRVPGYFGGGVVNYERIALESDLKQAQAVLQTAIQESRDKVVTPTREDKVVTPVVTPSLPPPSRIPGAVPIPDIPQFNVHNVQSKLLKEHLEKRGLADQKVPHRVPLPSTKEIQTVNVRISDLTCSWKEHSLLQSWNSPTMKFNEQGHEFIDTIEWERGRRVIICLYQNGSAKIHIESTNNDLDAPAMIALWGFLQATFLQRCGYSWNDVADLFEVYHVEFNKDGEIHAIDGGRDWANCWTMTGFFGSYVRCYKKDIEGRAFIRSELIQEPNVSFSKWQEEVLVLMTGGVQAYENRHYQYLFYQQMERQIREVKELKDVVADALKKLVDSPK